MVLLPHVAYSHLIDGSRVRRDAVEHPGQLVPQDFMDPSTGVRAVTQNETFRIAAVTLNPDGSLHFVQAGSDCCRMRALRGRLKPNSGPTQD